MEIDIATTEREATNWIEVPHSSRGDPPFSSDTNRGIQREPECERLPAVFEEILAWDMERLLLGEEADAIGYLRARLESLDDDRSIVFRGPLFQSQPNGDCICQECTNKTDSLCGCRECYGDGVIAPFESPVTILAKWRAIAQRNPQVAERLNPLDLYEEMYFRAGAPVKPVAIFVGNDGYQYCIRENGVVARAKRDESDQHLSKYLWVRYEEWETTGTVVRFEDEAFPRLTPNHAEMLDMPVSIVESAGQEAGAEIRTVRDLISVVGGDEGLGTVQSLGLYDRIAGIRMWNEGFGRRGHPFYSDPVPPSFFCDVALVLDLFGETQLRSILAKEGFEVGADGNYECSGCGNAVSAVEGCIACESIGDVPPTLMPSKIINRAGKMCEQVGFSLAIDELLQLIASESGRVEDPVAAFAGEDGSVLVVFGNNYAGMVGSENEPTTSVIETRPRRCDLTRSENIVQYPYHLGDMADGLWDDRLIVVWPRFSRTEGRGAKMMPVQVFCRIFGYHPVPLSWVRGGGTWWSEEIMAKEGEMLDILYMDDETLRRYLIGKVPELRSSSFWHKRGFVSTRGRISCRACNNIFDFMTGCGCKKDDGSNKYVSGRAFFDRARLAGKGIFQTEGANERWLLSEFRRLLGTEIVKKK